MDFPENFYLSEVRNGYYVPSMMKRNWAAQLEVLSEVDRVCKLHNIKYFIDSGTLLGAVRHKGFIPWDDDVDIIMLREDYDRFFNEAYVDLSPEMRRIDCEHFEKYVEMHGRIVNGITYILGDDEKMNKYHGFPLPAGIDIFPYDYVPDTPEGQDDFFLRIAPIEVLILQLKNIWDDKKKLLQEIKEAEEVIGYKLPRANDYDKQLRLLQDCYLKIVRGMVGRSHHATAVNFWANHKNYGIEDTSCFEKQEWIPFEHFYLPAPCKKEEALTEWFGKNYMQEYRGGGGHGYPYFFKMMEPKYYEIPYVSKHVYCINHDEWMDRKPVKGPAFLDCLKVRNVSLTRMRNILFDLINSGKLDDVLVVLEKLQNHAIEMGTIIEKRYEHALDSDEEKLYAKSLVSTLEVYCEALYGISNGDADSLEKLLSAETEITNKLETFNPNRKLVVFMPDRVETFENQKSLYFEMKNSRSYEVRVIPVPYFYKDRGGQIEKELQYDGDKFPKEIEITNYQDFVFDNPCPDEIIISNAYDDWDDGYTVHPFFYSENLQTFTTKLTYIPWFTIDEINEGEFGMQIAVFFANIPGVVRADEVILPSENMRNVYLNALGGILSEDNLELMSKKIIVKNA